MDKKPKISCIMSVYNTEKYLDECIQSILNQTYTDFEFIISDDGSTDKSKEIIRKYAKKDKRIVFLDNKENRGIVANLNDCIDRAKGDYIAIMESDDISYPERFDSEVNELNRDKELMLIGGNGDLINESGEIIGTLGEFMDFDFKKQKSYYLIIGFSFCTPSVMFKRNALYAVGEKFYSNLLWDFCFYSHIIFKGLKCKNIYKRLIKKREYLNALHIRKSKEIELEYFKRRIEFIKKYRLRKDDLFMPLKVIFIFCKSRILFYGIYLLKILGIYNIPKPLWWRFVLHKQFVND